MTRRFKLLAKGVPVTQLQLLASQYLRKAAVVPTLCPEETPTLSQGLKTLSASVTGRVGGTSGSDSQYWCQVSVCVHREKDSAGISAGDTFSRM